MLWNEIFISENNQSESKLKTVISGVFGVRLEDIVIISEITLFSGQRKEVICEVSEGIEGFPTRLSFYVNDDLKPKNDIETVAIITEKLGCDCLIDDDIFEPLNPYSWLLFRDRKYGRIYYTNFD